MSEEKQVCRGLPRGWAWRSSGPTMLLCATGDKDIQAVAGVGQSGLYALYPDKSTTILGGELHRSTPRDGENAQAAGQREAVEALWACGGFGDACPPLALANADLQCIAEGLHDNHVSETGVRWANVNKRTRLTVVKPLTHGVDDKGDALCPHDPDVLSYVHWKPERVTCQVCIDKLAVAQSATCEPNAPTDAGELARLLVDMPARVRVARAWFIGLGDNSPDAMIAASFIRTVELLLGERVDLRESRDGALRQRDAAEADRDIAQEAARTLCEKQTKYHVAALLDYEKQLARADRLWIGGEKRETALRVRVAELEADVRRLQAQIEASAELHREDRKRADDLANVPG